MRRVIADLVRRTIARRSGVGDDEHVHELRTLIKRIRAYLRLLGTRIGASWCRRTDLELRDAARELAKIRDRAVMLKTVEGMLDGANEAILKNALEGLRARLDSEEAAADGDTGEGPAARAAERVLVEMAESFEWEPVAPTSGRPSFEAGLKKTYRKARRGMRRWMKSGSVKDAHRWRKQTKYLMFQIQFLRRAWPGKLSTFHRKLSGLEKCLGKAHDLAMLGECMAKPESGGDGLRRAIERISALRKSCLRRAEKMGKKILDDRPGRFAEAIGTRWRHWARHDGPGAASRA